MGSYYEHVYADLYIRPGQEKAAAEAIERHSGQLSDDNPHLSDIERLNAALAGAQSQWEANTVAEGVAIEFFDPNGEYRMYDSDLEHIEVLAPFLRSGSSVEFITLEGATRYQVNHGRVHENRWEMIRTYGEVKYIYNDDAFVVANGNCSTTKESEVENG